MCSSRHTEQFQQIVNLSQIQCCPNTAIVLLFDFISHPEKHCSWWLEKNPETIVEDRELHSYWCNKCDKNDDKWKNEPNWIMELMIVPKHLT